MNLAWTGCRLCLLLLTITAVTAIGCNEKHPQVVQTPPPMVKVSQPIQDTVTDYQVFTARTAAVESVDVKARVTGYLTKIQFKDGDLVKKDDVLFEIDDRPYKAALDLAMGNLEFAKAALVKNQADYDIGLAVQKQNKGAISEQELTKRLGARDESKASIDKAKADLENAQLNYGWCKVASPITGRANRHFVDAGNVVSKDVTTLTNIVSLKPIWAYFDVDENSAQAYQRKVKKGEVKSFLENNIHVTMALAGNQDFSIKGETDFISNQFDPNTGSIRVRAVFSNDSGNLEAGLFARIRVPTSPPHPALLVRESAIGTNQGQKFIMVVNDKSIVEAREVEVGQVHGEGLREIIRYRTITEPGPDGKNVTKQVEVLKPTDRVIVLGLLRARDGAPVAPQLVNMQTLLPEGSGAADNPSGKTKP
jgi:RND family efflux transporter MFP subunit